MKVNVKRLIRESKKELYTFMAESLDAIIADYIRRIMNSYDNATPANKVNAAMDIPLIGMPAYKADLLEAAAVITGNTIAICRQEIPKVKNPKLSERIESLRFGEIDKLPPKIKKRVKNQINTLVDVQEGDISKAIVLQFNSSVASTDSRTQIEFDLKEKAADYIEGNSVLGAADVTAGTIVNETRLAFFTSEDVTNEIECFKFMNETPETAICRDLSNDGKGRYFSKDDPGLYRYQPPLHWNCESYILPVLIDSRNSNIEIEPLKPSSPELEKQIQFNARCSCGTKHYLLDYRLVDDIDF